ncbi:MAG: hypothetical protein QM621_10000 [Aeromicrobium sp.]|uniref:hypothetical protein n=1 Tax=Aeromicrobium sp. TaxID=1871063 RepID=UPI0039E62219
MDTESVWARPLVFEVPCTTSAQAEPGPPHRVVVEPDGTVTTPHDADAERAAAALGGYRSCVDLVEEAVAVFREALPLWTRQERPSMEVGRWGQIDLAPAQRKSCCYRALSRYRPGHDPVGDAQAVWDHVLGAEHQALVLVPPRPGRGRMPGLHGRPSMKWERRVPVGHLAALTEAALTEAARAASPPVPSCGPETSRLASAETLAELWACGVHPDELRRFARFVDIVGEPLTAEFYVVMVYGDVDEDRLARLLRLRPTVEAAVWLALRSDAKAKGSTDEWEFWLSAGLTLPTVFTALDGGMAPEQVTRLAERLDRPVVDMARTLVRWFDTLCLPEYRHFQALRRHGVHRPRLDIDEIFVLYREVRQRREAKELPPGTATRTDLAVMLEILGGREAVLDALGEGVDSLDDLDAYVMARPPVEPDTLLPDDDGEPLHLSDYGLDPLYHHESTSWWPHLFGENFDRAGRVYVVEDTQREDERPCRVTCDGEGGVVTTYFCGDHWVPCSGVMEQIIARAEAEELDRHFS